MLIDNIWSLSKIEFLAFGFAISGTFQRTSLLVAFKGTSANCRGSALRVSKSRRHFMFCGSIQCYFKRPSTSRSRSIGFSLISINVTAIQVRIRVSSKQSKINFDSNRNKPKQDLFCVCYGLFRETNKKQFRLVSVFQTYIETTETNRSVS